ncbi:acetyltransferase [Paenibacillus spongiae]|uniref:Acetyltransferase n=1 Tax=Paenibacillus spongiae TaxID=2909671 RepID=A0ABY5SCY2_9BACL|nr:acetyltransferase [Paenibacillus spongiae]UVI31529.1 acetyltransferase [Paenibacillus spongiae]
MDRIVVIGSGGHAKVVIDSLEQSKQYTIIGLIDDNKTPGTHVYGYEVLGGLNYIQDHRSQIDGGIIAIGDNCVRSSIAARIMNIQPQFRFITSVHPSASIARGVTIGEGTVIMAGAVINSDTHIGKHCILNTKSSVDHDSSVGDFVSLAPNATTGGQVSIGRYSVLSLGASVIHGITIGEHSVIGAGSTVLSSIDSYVVAYGTPTRVVRTRERGERYL